jgi:acetylornithine deacetylase/succinyl-diaminopimelate desuccinylase-like protein
VLVYGHYDVQPPEPLDKWTSPPFEPTVRDGKIFARGVVDDKAQVFLHIKALEAHLAVNGALPVNIVMVIEGEEEVGSESLGSFLRDHRGELRADATVISDTTMFGPGQPSIVSSLRGIVYFQIDVTGPSRDLHSGAYGGAVVNPAMALARILVALQDENGRITIPGFHDRITESPIEMHSVPFDENAFLRDVGASELGGEPDFTVAERLWTRPTCDVHGLSSGYTGEGAKTVLPSTASAKLSCRLVPAQKPDEISKLFETQVHRVAPRGVTVRVSLLGSAEAWRADIEGPLFRAAQRALRSAFGKEVFVVGEGGTIPIVGDFERILHTPVLLVGFGLPGQNAHAPDEWISIENFRGGMRAIAALWHEYAKECAS